MLARDHDGGCQWWPGRITRRRRLGFGVVMNHGLSVRSHGKWEKLFPRHAWLNPWEIYVAIWWFLV
jgi:hypothetical protein